MTSMKSFELAGRKTNQTAHSQTAGSTGLIGGLFGALGALFQRIEVSLEKSRVLAELERAELVEARRRMDRPDCVRDRDSAGGGENDAEIRSGVVNPAHSPPLPLVDPPPP